MVRGPIHMVLALCTVPLLGALGGCTGGGDEAANVVVIDQREPRFGDASLGPLTPADEVLIQATAQGLVRFDARGQIVPGIAERWNVSDDGLSYIFRLQSGKWPNGRTINAKDVARLLKRQLAAGSRNELKDTLGAIGDVVAMTDRVIEIRLDAPRPNLLQLLAQPAFGIIRAGQGSGPFQPDVDQDAPGAIALTYVQRVIDGPDIRDHVHLSAADAKKAVASFDEGKIDLVLGGTIDTLPVARQSNDARQSLRFDPASGLFGLMPARRDGPAADASLRSLLNRAIDRAALIDSLGVPGLSGRATLLQDGLEGIGALPPPAWLAVPIADRRAALLAEARQLFGAGAAPTVTVALPTGPGGTILYDRLVADWGALGVKLVRVAPGKAADFVTIDAVAPSSSPAWFVRQFRCGVAPVCDKQADGLMDSGRQANVGAQRAAFLLEASRLLDARTAFIPLAAPVRWSLVSKRIPGFAENPFARHPLTGLRNKLSREGE